MEKLNDRTLLDAYKTAVRFNLDKEFLLLLEREINRRNLWKNVEVTNKVNY